METYFTKDLTPCVSQNNKVRIFGTLVSEPEPYYDSRFYYVKLNCPLNSSLDEPAPNNIIVCLNEKTKIKYFDSHQYNLNDQLIVHGTTRNFTRSFFKQDGSKCFKDEFFVMMERVHRYPNQGQVFYKNNIGIAVGKISRYVPRTPLNGKPFIDVVLNVHRDPAPACNMLNLSTIGKPMQKIMKTHVGDEVGFKYAIRSYTKKSGHDFMTLCAFYVCTDPDKLQQEEFLDFDYTPNKTKAPENDLAAPDFERNYEIRKRFVEENNLPPCFFDEIMPITPADEDGLEK